MLITHYAHLHPTALRARARYLTRHEQEMQERLTAWERHVLDGQDGPDPIRKRLLFLLLAQRRRRLATEKELATRQNVDRRRSLRRALVPGLQQPMSRRL